MNATKILFVLCGIFFCSAAQASYSDVTVFNGDRAIGSFAIGKPLHGVKQRHIRQRHANHQRKTRYRASVALDANGNGVVRSHKTGATAHVSPSYSGLFQAYINELEDRGAKILFMGGYRKGHCWSGGLHPCGKALDVCQYSRGVVEALCNLPRPQELAAIAERHGLFEGGLWCHNDYGHAQVGETARRCSYRHYAAGTQVHHMSARRRVRVARR